MGEIAQHAYYHNKYIYVASDWPTLSIFSMWQFGGYKEVRTIPMLARPRSETDQDFETLTLCL